MQISSPCSTSLATVEQSELTTVNPAWSNVSVLKQTLTFIATLSTKTMYYIDCSPVTQCKETFINGDKDWPGSCVSCPPQNALTTKCNNGGCASEGIQNCRNGKNPIITACTSGTQLLAQYGISGQMMFKTGYCGPLDDPSDKNACLGICNATLYCRGQVDLEKSMDLGGTDDCKAWTEKNRSPSEVDDIKLATYATDKSDLFSAVAVVRWDFTGFVDGGYFDNVALLNLSRWINALRNTSNAATTDAGTLVVAQRVWADLVRDTAYSLGVAHFLYESMYTTPTIDSSTQYHTDCNVLDNEDVASMSASYVENVHSRFITQYTGDITNAIDLQAQLLLFARPPIPSVDADGTGWLTLSLSMKQALSLLVTPEQSKLMATSFVCNFLQDVEFASSVQRPGTNKEQPKFATVYFPGVDVVPSSSSPPVAFPVEWMTAESLVVQIKDEYGIWKTGGYAPGGKYQLDTAGQVLDAATNLQGKMVMQYEVRFKVETWSIMLVAYFQSVLGIPPMPGGVACSVFDGTTELVSRSCFQSASSSEQAGLATSSCEIRYNPPFASTGSMPELMLYAGSVDTSYDGGRLCACYNTNLAPSLQRDNPESKTASRCYSVKCNEDQRLEMNLTSEVCSAASVCDRMWGWLNSKDPAQQGVDLDSFDWVRYKLLCGRSIQPLGEDFYDWRMFLATGVACVSLAAVVAALPAVRGSKWVRVSALRYAVVCVLLVVAGLLFAALLGWLLCGKAVCSDQGEWPRASLCVSRALGTPLLAQSCAFKAQCECQLDSDCGPSGCVCPSGFCVDAVGVRGTVRTGVTTVDALILVPLLALAVLVPCLIVLWARPELRRSALVVGSAVCSALLLAAIGCGASIRTDPSVLSFSAKPACGVLGKRLLVRVIDLETKYIVTFPTTSTWNATGFPGTTSPSWQAPAYVGFVKEERDLAYTEIQKALGEKWMIDANVRVLRELQVIVNDVDSPNPRSFYILQVAGSGSTFRGACVAASREQSTVNPIDVWTVAWGNAQLSSSVGAEQYDLGEIATLPNVLDVSAESGTKSSCNLYSYVTAPGTASDIVSALMVIGPQCVTAVTEPGLFEAAENALKVTLEEAVVLREHGVLTKSASVTSEDIKTTACIQAMSDVSGASAVVCTLTENVWRCRPSGRPSSELAPVTSYACPTPATTLLKSECGSCRSKR